MAKNTTLSDLNDFLTETGEKGVKKVKSAEEFLNSDPENIGKTRKLAEEEVENLKLKNSSIEDLAVHINLLAQKKGMSYAEVCMELLEKGSEITQVLKGGGVVTTLYSANKTAFNVIKNAINSRLKG